MEGEGRALAMADGANRYTFAIPAAQSVTGILDQMSAMTARQILQRHKITNRSAKMDRRKK